MVNIWRHKGIENKGYLVSDTVTAMDEHRANTKTSKREWLNTAKKVLIAEGAAHVKVYRLAQELNVTRGGFYWFFKDRQDLLDQLIADWRDRDNDPMMITFKEDHDEPLRYFTDFLISLIKETEYTSTYDSAFREWAKTSKKARTAVERVDARRIGILSNVYKSLGLGEDDAFIRARIMYFHQIGYYAMEVHETLEVRVKFLPIYFKHLTGYDMPDYGLNTLNAMIK